MFGVLESVKKNKLQIIKKKKIMLSISNRWRAVFDKEISFFVSNYLIILSLLYNGDET